MGIFSRKKPKIVKQELKEGLSTGIVSQEIDQTKLIQYIRERSTKRIDKINLYAEMIKDGVVDSALELIADDTTQPSDDTGKIVWVESVDQNLANKLNAFLENVIKVDQNVWTWVYQLLFSGEVYLKTYYSEYSENPEKYKKKFGSKFNIHREKETHRIYHVMKNGVSEGFYVANVDKDGNQSGKGVLYPNSEYVHMMIDKNFVFSKEENKLKLRLKRNDSGEDEEYVYDILQGTSFLESAVQPWKIVRILEDVLIMHRLSKSAYFQIVSVNVGNASKGETVRILNDVRNTIQRKEVIGSDAGSYYRSINNPAPLGQFLYVPVRDGKGEIKVEAVQQDVNIKDIVDIYYFRNKLHATLIVPKAYLGQEQDLPGGIGDNSITRQDIRYCRTIKRMQNIIKQGVKELCIRYLERLAEDKPNLFTSKDFSVQMARVSSAEDDEKANERASRIEYAQSVVSTLLGDFGRYVNKRELLNHIVTNVLKLDASKIILPEGQENEEIEESGYEDFEPNSMPIERTPSNQELEDSEDTTEPTLASVDRKLDAVLLEDGWVEVDFGEEEDE